MSRLARGALVLAGAILVLVAALAALGWIASRRSDRLLAAAGRALGRDVRAERLGFTLRGGVGVTLGGVAIADDPAFEAREPFLSARSLDMRLRILPLLRRTLVVDRIEIDEPVVNLVRDRSGRLNVDSLRKGSKEAETREPSAPSPRRPFQLASLRLRHGTVRYRDAATGRTVELSDVAVDARQPRLDAPVPISVRAGLATEDLHLDDITSEGVVDFAAERPSYHGSLSASGAVGAIAIDKLTADVRATPPVIDLESSRVETLGGTITGTAHLSSADEQSGLTARLDAVGLDLARLPARQDRPRPGGTLELHGEIAGPPGAAGFKTGATGHGEFAVADGRVAGAGIGRGVLDALQPFLRPGVADRLRQRYPDLLASDDLRFTRLSGSGRLAGGRIRSDDLVLAAPSYDARGSGSLGLDGDVDASLRLAAGRALTDDVLGQQARARAVLVDERGQLTIPLRVHGPLHHPQVTPDPAFAATVARALLGEAGLGEAASGLIERFLGGKRRQGR